MLKAASLFLITVTVLSRLLMLRYSTVTMPSSDSDPLDHSELISVLTELYTLLDTASLSMGRLSFEAGCLSLHTDTHMDGMQRLTVVCPA